MWIVVTVVVVSMAIAGIVMALRNETSTPSRQVVPSVTQGAATVVVPDAPAAGAAVGDGSQGKRQVGSGSAFAPGGYVLNGGTQHIPQR